MKKNILIIGIIILIVVSLICLIIYYESRYINVGFREIYFKDDGYSMKLGGRTITKEYIITHSRKVIKSETSNGPDESKNKNIKTIIGKLQKEDLNELRNLIQDKKIQNESSGSVQGSFAIIKDDEYKITDEFRVQLEEFIKEKIVK